jgi:DNA-binding MarR family transcriptional regulator
MTARSAWRRMREIVLESHDRRKAVSDALGMSFLRTKALRRVAREPLTLRELAEFLVNDRPYTTLIVDDLERRGLVRRTEHPTDRRSKLVTITEQGLAMANEAHRIFDEPPKSLRALSKSDLAELERILDKLD